MLAVSSTACVPDTYSQYTLKLLENIYLLIFAFNIVGHSATEIPKMSSECRGDNEDNTPGQYLKEIIFANI